VTTTLSRTLIDRRGMTATASALYKQFNRAPKLVNQQMKRHGPGRGRTPAVGIRLEQRNLRLLAERGAAEAHITRASRCLPEFCPQNLFSAHPGAVLEPSPSLELFGASFNL